MEELVASAQHLRCEMGWVVFQAAGDDSDWRYAMALVNGGVVGSGWCRCGGKGNECYYADEDGYHGWMCDYCLGITQTG